MKDTPSGTFKNIMVERIDSIEQHWRILSRNSRQSAGTDCDFDLFLPDRLETGTLVIGAGYSGISFLFWNDAGL